MPLVNLKQTKKEVKENSTEVCCNPGTTASEPQYPWGTRITLEKGSLDKLTIDLAALTVGDVLEGSFKLKVIGIRQVKRDKSDEESLELQITDMDIGDGPVKQPAIKGKIDNYKKIRDGYPSQEE